MKSPKLRKAIKQLLSKKKKEESMTPMATNYPLKPKCEHKAEKPVMIGGYPVYLGAGRSISEEQIAKMDLIYPLNGYMPYAYFGSYLPIIACDLPDRGGVPDGWKEFIIWTIEEIKKGTKVVAYCTGGHGRTGTFGASLIALMEPEHPDPIDAIRARHCKEAVESLKQATAIFALRDQELPERYKKEFAEINTSFSYSTSNFDQNVICAVKRGTSLTCFNTNCDDHVFLCDLDQGWKKCSNPYCKKHGDPAKVAKREAEAAARKAAKESKSQETPVVPSVSPATDYQHTKNVQLLTEAYTNKLIIAWGTTIHPGETKTTYYWIHAEDYTIDGVTPERVETVLSDLKAKQKPQ